MQLTLKCCSCAVPLLKVHSAEKLENALLPCALCGTPQNPALARQIIASLETLREDLRATLLSTLTPEVVYDDVMRAVESLDMMLAPPCVYYARWNELVHHLFLLMADKQVVKK